MKYITEILGIVIAIALLIATACHLPIIVKLIFGVAAIMYALENFVAIFKKIRDEDKAK